eukprot:3403662-Rhodomonas_salina.2
MRGAERAYGAMGSIRIGNLLGSNDPRRARHAPSPSLSFPLLPSPSLSFPLPFPLALPVPSFLSLPTLPHHVTLF